MFYAIIQPVDQTESEERIRMSVQKALISFQDKLESIVKVPNSLEFFH